MSYRCINAFSFEERVVAGGAEVPDDDPILSTHADHFVKVAEPFVGVETTVAAPGEPRHVEISDAPKKASPAKKVAARKTTTSHKTQEGGI